MIEIKDGRFGRHVHATAPIPTGTLIIEGWGRRLPGRTRHSFQVDLDTHVLIPGPIELINHSCDPNCGVLVPRGAQTLQIYARRPIAAGEELRTDYASFEWHIEFMPKPCLCDTALCRGSVTGYKDLPETARRAYAPYIAEYLPELESSFRAAQVR
ncbi:MAG: SET domain-containing protein [Acidobacteria bacterium]|nr:SET domain-containing protein [Acidobacteriota bacterium]MCA1610563.1 SET domain-containing protein [Acidobacteriota bacterium]